MLKEQQQTTFKMLKCRGKNVTI